MHGRPLIHHSDQGGQYATPHFTNLLTGVQISMAEVGQAWQNGYAERVGALWYREGGKGKTLRCPYRGPLPANSQCAKVSERCALV